MNLENLIFIIFLTGGLTLAIKKNPKIEMNFSQIGMCIFMTIGIVGIIIHELVGLNLPGLIPLCIGISALNLGIKEFLSSNKFKLLSGWLLLIAFCIGLVISIVQFSEFIYP